MTETCPHTDRNDRSDRSDATQTGKDCPMTSPTQPASPSTAARRENSPSATGKDCSMTTTTLPVMPAAPVTRAPRRGASAAGALARPLAGPGRGGPVTALLPLGVALADDVNEYTYFNSGVDFNRSVRMFGPVQMTPLSSSGITLDVGTSDTAVRARGLSGVGVGVEASGATGVKATGSKIAVEAVGPNSFGTGVKATGETGVQAQGTGVGLVATSERRHRDRRAGVRREARPAGHRQQRQRDRRARHRGQQRARRGTFRAGRPPSGAAAAAPGAPQAASGTHDAGELYVDSAGQLFICTVAGTPGTWVKVGAQQ